jgi:2-polyprenyl-6-methoxyphenol hydroxylase-like FAD-dependent oxidoreductase
MGQTPSIAILGAGPIGVEAALAAAERGLDFTLYEAAPAVGGHVRSWGHVRLFTPWSMNLSRRMRSRLLAADRPAPDGDACPTGAEFLARVLEPLAALPEIAPRLRLGSRVVSVGRQGLLKHEEIATAARQSRPFRLLLRDASGREWTETASTVLDATGTWSNPNALGDGGIAAPGEAGLAALICHELPDIEADPGWARARVLLIGSGHSAQTAARQLAERRPPNGGWVWAMRRLPGSPLDDDPLVQRAALARSACSLAMQPPPDCEVKRSVVVESLRREGDSVTVVLRPVAGGGGSEVTVDRVLALVGSSPDAALYRQLQIHECYASAAPMKLASALLAQGGGSADCLDQQSLGADALRNPEPGFFILGVKSYGRNNNFLLRVGYDQVDEVFATLA